MSFGINFLSIKGFKSFRELNRFELGNLNVIIGANGAGKSNFIQFFHMLSAMANKDLSKFILERGGADNFLFGGPKETSEMELEIGFHSGYFYKAVFSPTADEKFLLTESFQQDKTDWLSWETVSEESMIMETNEDLPNNDETFLSSNALFRDLIASLAVYHFHDTSSSSPMRRSEIIEDNKRLRGNASNIAPFLLNIRDNYPREYNEIKDAIRLVMPFFDDFIIDVARMGNAEKVRLSWKQKGSDFPMQAYHLSDGSIRFICLATALLQPDLPSVIVIDEPELGLHPAALSILAELVQAAARKTQIIISTQSPMLIDHFGIEDVIVMTRENGASVLKRLDKDAFSIWLEDYSVGELWAKNVIE